MSFPVPQDEAELPRDRAERPAALRRYGNLDPAREEAFDRVTQLAASLFAVPFAFIALDDGQRRWFKSISGMAMTDAAHAAALAPHAVLGDEALVVADARADERFQDNPYVVGAPGVRFYAGAPLLTREGLRLGVLGIVDTRPRADFSGENSRQLQTLARLVMNELDLKLELAARRKAEQDLKLVNALMLAIAEAPSVNTAIETSMRLIGQAVGAAHGRAWTMVGRGRHCQLVAAWGPAGSEWSQRLEQQRKTPLTLNNSLVGAVLTENKRRVVVDVSAVSRRYAAAADALAVGLRAVICVPVRQNERNFALNFLFEEAPAEIEKVADRIEELADKVRPVLSRKLAEERITLLQSVVLHADDAVMVVEIESSFQDATGPRILYASPAMTRMTGYALEELYGRSPSMIWGGEPAAAMPAGLAALAGTQPARLELASRRKDGSSFWADISAVPMADEVTGDRRLIAILRDMTERRRLEEALRQSESTFRLLFSRNPIPMWAYDVASLCILEVNNAAVEQYGYSREAFLAMTLDDIAPPEPAPPNLGERRVIPAFGRLGICRHRRADGSDVMVDAVSHRFDFHGHQAAIMAALDVTEQQRAEDQIRQAKEAAEAASRAKSELLANMSHELRTPLNAIIGFSEIMQAGLFGPLGASKYDSYVADIRHSAGHLLTVITDILDLAKIEANSFRLQEGVVALSEIVASALRLVKPRADGAGVALRCDRTHDDIAIKVDETALKRVLINLLANAVKFSEPGGTVVVRSEFDAAGGFAISVSDQGIGMAPEEIPIALTPFRQVNSGLQRKYEGTGLGLPIAKELVEMHGGLLTITSARGAGTTVTVLLPAARVTVAA
ncbi:MAG TPA: ATP-binding protein [Stellaceae bacterium]|nr:ATP-binding protein [Stellaceae bacterium]